MFFFAVLFSLIHFYISVNPATRINNIIIIIKPLKRQYIRRRDMARVTIRGHRAIFAARTVETVTVGDVGT